MSNNFRIDSITIYPVKSLSGISLSYANVEEHGFQHDRRWMLVDNDLQFISQRKFPHMCMLEVSVEGNGLKISDKSGGDTLFVPYETKMTEVKVGIWSDLCNALKYEDSKINHWFSEKIGVSCSLIFAPEGMKRRVDTRYSPIKANTSFPDGFPYSLANTASLDDLNQRCEGNFEMKRFRPNIVFNGDKPFQEDHWKKIRIGEVEFLVVKPCSRCVMITVDPETGEKNNEPMKALAQYRRKNGKVYFAQNMVAVNTGIIKVGNELEVLEFNEK